MKIAYKNLMNLRKIGSDPKKLLFFLIIIAFVVFLNSFSLNVKSIEGRVLKIIDGDTIELLSKDKNTYKIRLWGIDAPETNTKQPFAKEAKDFLASKILNQEVRIILKDKDRYNRDIGLIEFKGEDINKMMVAKGYAWAYSYYTDAYVQEELKARTAKIGLWADKKPIEPYKWRKIHSKAAQ